MGRVKLYPNVSQNDRLGRVYGKYGNLKEDYDYKQISGYACYSDRRLLFL